MADIDITITISSADIADFRAGFLKCKPKEDPAVSDLNHFKNTIGEWIFNVYKTGKIMIARETTAEDIDENIITIS